MRAPHGIASLTGTTWLGSEPGEALGLPGRWFERDGRAVATGLDTAVELLAGEEITLGEVLVRVIRREGVLAVRGFDPAAPGRLSLTGIDAIPFDPAWVLQGSFTATEGAALAIDHVDGSTSRDAVAGTVRFSVDGARIALAAFPAPDGRLQITFADAGNGSTSQQFRFLTLPAPDASGAVEVDLNRAYLPPCAFSDHYLCPIPPAQNRLRFAVTAGETFVRRLPAA